MPDATDPIETVRAIFAEAIEVHRRFSTYGIEGIAAAAAAIFNAVIGGRKVLAFGNGGSATDAQHLVAELIGRFDGERRALAAIALTSDSAVLTAVGNDYGFEHVFTRQIAALGSLGDVAFAISTSGNSRNVELALAAAKAQGLVTVALTGCDGGRIGAHADIHLNVAERSTPRIQEAHRTIMHAMCALIDRAVRSETTS